MWRSYAMRGVCGLTVTVRDLPYNTSESDVRFRRKDV